MLMRILAVSAVAVASSTFADVTTTVDLVDASDGITLPPAGVVAVDVLVDVGADDVWTAGGLRGFVTPAGQGLGVALRYAGTNDSNTPHDDRLFNPGAGNRFSTFFSKPRNRDTAGRYTNGAAAVAGRYSPTGPIETSTATEVSIAWFASPPEGSQSPSADGAIARIALDVSGVEALPEFGGFVAGALGAATGPIIFQSSTDQGDPGTVSATFDVPVIVGIDWAVWYNVIPEPASLTLLILGGIAALRRR